VYSTCGHTTGATRHSSSMSHLLGTRHLLAHTAARPRWCRVVCGPLVGESGAYVTEAVLDAEEQLLCALKRADKAAATALFERFHRDINRLIWRFLGADPEHDDLVQQVFVQALASAHKLREASALRSWMVTLTVNTVRMELRRRKVRRIMHLTPDTTELLVPHLDDHDSRTAMRGVYQVLASLSIDERLAFSLRYIEGEALDDVAKACGCSLATIKRRLQAASAKFFALAEAEPSLAAYVARHSEVEHE